MANKRIKDVKEFHRNSDAIGYTIEYNWEINQWYVTPDMNEHVTSTYLVTEEQAMYLWDCRRAGDTYVNINSKTKKIRLGWRYYL